MGGIQNFQDGDIFWAWSITTDDINEELRLAVIAFEQRFQKRPFLVICSEEVRPKPVSGLRIETHTLVPPKIFYFPVPGSLAGTMNQRINLTKEVVAIEE